MQNVKQITVNLEPYQVRRINTTPALQLSHNRKVKEGLNTINVNHNEYSRIKRLWKLLDVDLI